MSFLALVLALLALRAGVGTAVLQRDDWFELWQLRAGSWFLSPWPRLIAVVGLPVLGAALLLNLLEDFLFGLPWIAAAACLLLYSLGRGDYAGQLERYRGWCRDGDFEAAWLAAGSEWQLVTAQAEPDSAQEVHDTLQRGLLYEGYQRWFPPVLYFLLLGPAGALLYRLLQLCRDDFESALARQCLFLLDWVPTRLLAATFALTGDFVASRAALQRVLADTEQDAASLLYAVARDAVAQPVELQGEGDGLAAAAQNRALQGLLSRSAGAWIIAISLVVLLS